MCAYTIGKALEGKIKLNQADVQTSLKGLIVLWEAGREGERSQKFEVESS